MNQQNFLNECIYGLYVIGMVIAFPILITFAVIHCAYKCLKSQVCSVKSIQGEVALITGSGRGLGRDIAISLAQLGCRIAVVDIQGQLAQNTAEHIAQTYGVKTKAYTINVTDYQQLLDLRSQVTNDLGDVTILINNAGILILSAIENPPPQEIQRMINVNLTAAIFTTQIFLPKMKQLNRDHIVNMASMAAVLPNPFFVVYGASKAALRHLTSSLRIDLMQSQCNITATTMFPVFLKTNERVNRLTKLVDINRMGPIIDGAVVAQYLVDAMLRGDDEVTVPRVLINVPKLMAFMPAFIVEKSLALLTDVWRKKSEGTAVRSIFQNDDIPMDL